MSYEWPGEASDISRVEFFDKYSEHSGWLQGSGNRMYLAHRSLSGLGLLGGLSLQNSDFAYSDLSGVEFNGCNLRSCSFTGANLTNTKFINCDMAFSSLIDSTATDVELTNCYLYNVSGNGREVKNFHISPLFLTYTSHVLQIDCINKSLDWWKAATLEEINEEINGLGQELNISWSGFMSPESVHSRLAIMFGLIDNAPAKQSINNDYL